jgi:peptidylprolyl isomerase
MTQRITPFISAAAWMLASAAVAQAPSTTPSSAPARAPSEIVSAAPASAWTAIDPADLLIIDLAPDAEGHPRRVIIQLVPAPFSAGWVSNIRALANAHWWDGTSVNRVQDNYVVQWGDASEAKPLPAGLRTVPEADYVTPISAFSLPSTAATAPSATEINQARQRGVAPPTAQPRATLPDLYASGGIVFAQGWPLATDGTSLWPVHCYGAVGVGRNLSPDTGSGAELYTVIGHAPRHLDRNIAVVGRVIEGIEHLSSLPRGTEALGFYGDPAQRVPIVHAQIGSALPVNDRPHFQYLSTESADFAAYAQARANRRDAFFNIPAGAADVCNVPVPVRRAPQLSGSSASP